MRGKHLDPPHNLGCIQPSLALPCRAASLKLAGTARYPRPDLPQGAGCCLASHRWSLDVPGHTHRQHHRGSHGPAAAVPGAVLTVGRLSGCSGVREHGWPRAVENERAKAGLCQREPQLPAPLHRLSVPRLLPKTQGSCCVITSSQPSSQEM